MWIAFTVGGVLAVSVLACAFVWQHHEYRNKIYDHFQALSPAGKKAWMEEHGTRPEQHYEHERAVELWVVAVWFVTVPLGLVALLGVAIYRFPLRIAKWYFNRRLYTIKALDKLRGYAE